MTTVTQGPKSDNRTDWPNVAHAACRGCHSASPDFYVAFCGELVPGDEPWFRWPDGPSPCADCISTMRCPLCGTPQRMRR